jgi:SAM-dependent methyltransferase
MRINTAFKVDQFTDGRNLHSECKGCGERHAIPYLSAPDRFYGRKKAYKLMRCPSCSLVWIDNPPKPDEMSEHYGSDYDRWVAAAGDSSERWRGRVDTIAKYRSGGRLLDLGCSSGGFLKAMKSPRWELYGIEISEDVASRAGCETGAKMFVGDICDAPYVPASFDVIVCFHVFEHLYEPQAVLKKVSEWLKPGGIFYVMLPNIDSAGARVFRSYWYALELPRHLYHFSPKSLSRMTRSVGLEEVSMVTGREVFLEKSVHYIVDDLLERVGISRVPLARWKEPSVPFKVLRKMRRLTVDHVLTAAIGLVGDGESIHAVFRKSK